MRIGMNLPGPFWISGNIGGHRRRRSYRKRPSAPPSKGTMAVAAIAFVTVFGLALLGAWGLFVIVPFTAFIIWVLCAPSRHGLPRNRKPPTIGQP